MKYVILTVIIMVAGLVVDLPSDSTFGEYTVQTAEASVKRIRGYYRSDGSYVKSHFRDTSGDGVKYNNANYQGWNK